MTIKVVVLCSSEAARAALELPESVTGGVAVTVRTGTVQELPGILHREHPDLVVLDLPAADEPAMAQIEAALLKAPGTHLMLVTPEHSAAFLRRAMRAGVREVLPAPLGREVLQEAIQQAQSLLSLQTHPRSQDGQVLAFIACKGGAGNTFLATNLAYALAKQGKRVAVLDLNLYLGDAAVLLSDSRPMSTVVDLVRQTQRLDPTLLDSSMIKVNSNLHVLAAPDSPEHVNEVSGAGVAKLIELARSRYDFVVMDVSRTLDTVAVMALERADAIFLTLQLDIPFIRASRRMADVFRILGYPGRKLSVVVNRYEKGGSISLEDVEKATLLKVGRTIPNSFSGVSASVNQGVPLEEISPRDPVARALHEWAQQLAPAAADEHEGWLRRLMKHHT